MFVINNVTIVSCGLQIEQLFSSGFSLHAEDASDHFSKATAAALQEQQKAADTQPAALPSSSNPPLDWSIKTAVRFSSAEPFAIAEEALTVSAGTGKLGCKLPRCLRLLHYRYFLETISHP